LDPVPYLSRLGKARVHAKLENLQHTGAFKVRGAMNKILSLTEEERARGVVAASTGNHGAGVAYSLKRLEAKGTVFVPNNTPPTRIEAIERMGAEVRRHGNDCVETEVFTRRYAEENRMTYVSPYNDLHIVAGQGTISVELARQLDEIDAVFVALGGGGLVSGIAAHFKSIRPEVKIMGCSPENSQVMIQSVKAGEILDLPSRPTLSDSTAGGLEEGAITFDLCRELVDEYITVTEDEIRESLRDFIRNQHMLIEGAAAVAVASYLKVRERFEGRSVVLIICGANIGLETLKSVL
jgi:threonine dehydratase